MRPDLQELEITLGELKRLTGLKCSLDIFKNYNQVTACFYAMY
jgi:hypothetical protein